MGSNPATPTSVSGASDADSASDAPDSGARSHKISRFSRYLLAGAGHDHQHSQRGHDQRHLHPGGAAHRHLSHQGRLDAGRQTNYSYDSRSDLTAVTTQLAGVSALE